MSATLKAALQSAIHHLERHAADYHYAVPADVLDALRLAAVEPDDDYLTRVSADRHRLARANEGLVREVEMLRRTAGYMPRVGILCDGPGCRAAIGVVGTTSDTPIDDVGIATMKVANSLGWTTRHDAKIARAADGPALDVTPRHYCPRCKEST